MKIRGMELEVDVRFELSQFDWENASWEEDEGKLIANSPFRKETRPSFFVRFKPFGDLPSGVWSDSGGTEGYTSGGFPKLLAHLRGIMVEEAEDYLLDTYSEIEMGYRDIEIFIPELRLQGMHTFLKEDLLENLEINHDYLKGRGISTEVQERMGVRYDSRRQAIAIPWRDVNGNLTNVKYRKTDGSKIFWYEKGATPISHLVYNLHSIYERKANIVVLTEAEIDSMTFEHFIPSIALGGSNFSERKAELIAKSTIEKLVIATDNDAVGRKLKKQITERLLPYMEIYHLDYPRNIKDANELGANEQLKECIRKAKRQLFELNFIL